MKNVRIGGVPEHFNYAWYLALKQGHFKKQNIEFFGRIILVVLVK